MKKSREQRARDAWCKPEQIGKRVHTPDGFGMLVEARQECLGCRVSLESGGWNNYEASWLTMANEQYE
jgi:hypothetical protein